ncbi:MAG TPA: hypothetical protein VG603_12000, partial [Chitinophagales bacterium]|nr:hypothetical protein [Chitinophagales bacterium]
MKYSVPVAAMLAAFGFTIWLKNQAPCEREPHEPIENLYESPDDPDGAGGYDFARLHDPALGAIPYNIRKKELAFAAHLPGHNGATRSNTQWQNRGPYNLGGRTRALALDVTNENIILAGQVTGGMWRSDDGGAHFTQTTAPQQLH